MNLELIVPTTLFFITLFIAGYNIDELYLERKNKKHNLNDLFLYTLTVILPVSLIVISVLYYNTFQMYFSTH